MIFTVINIGTGYLNRPNWLLAGYSVYHRVASQGFPAGFPAHIVYDRHAISSPATVRAGRPRVYRFMTGPRPRSRHQQRCVRDARRGGTQQISSFSFLFTVKQQ